VDSSYLGAQKIRRSLIQSENRKGGEKGSSKSRSRGRRFGKSKGVGLLSSTAVVQCEKRGGGEELLAGVSVDLRRGMEIKSHCVKLDINSPSPSV